MASEQSIIYVIDDDESVRRAFERLLRSADLKVETFASAEEFLRGERQGENACIVVDIRMPGLTGFDLQQNMATRGIQIPVIVISASDDAQTREQARRLGAAAFFRKPIDDQALLDAIWWSISEALEKTKDRSRYVE
ncbi:MAG: response regulator [Desulfobacterales bacterium]|nr:response regulator [Desulfobacterales bacterium]